MTAERLRVEVYDHFRRTGRAPLTSELAAHLGMTQADVTAPLATLSAARHVQLDDLGEIAMAHPFSAVPLGSPRQGMSGGTSWISIPFGV